MACVPPFLAHFDKPIDGYRYWTAGSDLVQMGFNQSACRYSSQIFAGCHLDVFLRILVEFLGYKNLIDNKTNEKKFFASYSTIYWIDLFKLESSFGWFCFTSFAQNITSISFETPPLHAVCAVEIFVFVSIQGERFLLLFLAKREDTSLCKMWEMVTCHKSAKNGWDCLKHLVCLKHDTPKRPFIQLVRIRDMQLWWTQSQKRFGPPTAANCSKFDND